MQKNPDPDAEGFVAYDADQQRERKYELRAQIERHNRQASPTVINGEGARAERVGMSWRRILASS